MHPTAAQCQSTAGFAEQCDKHRAVIRLGTLSSVPHIASGPGGKENSMAMVTGQHECLHRTRYAVMLAMERASTVDSFQVKHNVMLQKITAAGI